METSKYYRALVCVCSIIAGVCVHAFKCTADDNNWISKIDKSIVKEPKYRAKPRYALLVIGAESKIPIWIVHDDDRLYVDKNGNRDLTDDGPAIEATQKRRLDRTSWDRNFVTAEWKMANGSHVRDFGLRNWNYSDPEDQYGLSLTVDDKVPLYAGWNALLSPSSKKAPVIHLGGPVSPQMLRYQKFELGTKPERFSIAFATPRELKIASARLNIDGLPATVKPIANIQWPTKSGDPPLVTSHLLSERCCYWEFYTEDFRIPDKATTGIATVTILVPLTEFPLELSIDHFEVPVVSKK
jgi:hypothetical protein